MFNKSGTGLTMSNNIQICMSAELPLPENLQEIEDSLEEIIDRDAMEQLSDQSSLGRLRNELRQLVHESADQEAAYTNQLQLMHRFLEIREEVPKKKGVNQANAVAGRKLRREIKNNHATIKTKLEQEGFLNRLLALSQQDAEGAR